MLCQVPDFTANLQHRPYVNFCWYMLRRKNFFEDENKNKEKEIDLTVGQKGREGTKTNINMSSIRAYVLK